MQASMFNVRVPLDTMGERDDVFLMNTFTDSQLIVSRDVAALLDQVGSRTPSTLTAEEREALSTLADQGFIVPDRDDGAAAHRRSTSTTCARAKSSCASRC